ncbi:MAG: hypothetical protein RMN53_07935, partial [Anaerolineae bacterium]|nr:hypothetical protein [Anaerolineae bacterium]
EPPAPAPTPAVAAAVNRIVLVDPEGRLATVAPDGSDLRTLTPAGPRFQFPAWSPDAGRVAATGGDDERGLVVVVADRPGAAPTTLYESALRPPFYLYWSPDGRRISFLANEPSGALRPGIALHLVPADGGAESRIVQTGQPFYWQWTADSSRLFIHVGGAGRDARLAFVAADGQVVQEGLAIPGFFQAPGISPNGRWLSFAEATDAGSQVVALRPADGQRRTAPHRGLAAMSWSPAADLLAFTSPTADSASFFGPLRLLDVETGSVDTLVNETVFCFFWSPDGRAIAYLTRDDGRRGPQVGRSKDFISDAQPQGHPPIRLRLSLVDVASGQVRTLTTFQPTAVFITQFIPFFDQYALSHRLWSPAGDALVLPMVDDQGQEGIYVVSASGDAAGERRRVADGSMAFWSPR